MTEVRNLVGKLVCRLDEQSRTIEIAQKGNKTLIHFKSDGTTEINNTAE